MGIEYASDLLLNEGDQHSEWAHNVKIIGLDHLFQIFLTYG
jgi:hypothetical protein